VPSGKGVFIQGQHTFSDLTRPYKLYTPAGADRAEREWGQPLPLVVMLHGCKQSADDFAAGTAMNDWADRLGFLVLYPEQTTQANAHRCWQWFVAKHQQRGAGEVGLLADLSSHIVRSHGLDARRVYVAGLSAGGAMAAVLGAAYPDVFAAVGVHSGLAPGAAHSLPEALMAMNGGLRGNSMGMPFQGAASPRSVALPLPVIVFHGDDDSVVHPSNGVQLIAAARLERQGEERTQAARVADIAADTAQGGGRRYTRSVHAAGPDHPAAEHWLVHGAGHAWSGGRAAGSYTDPLGPDASAEMLRFFLAHPRTTPGNA
jgi:poly(hydroxyalkanoate) depolymerase family esterase